MKFTSDKPGVLDHSDGCVGKKIIPGHLRAVQRGVQRPAWGSLSFSVKENRPLQHPRFAFVPLCLESPGKGQPQAARSLDTLSPPRRPPTILIARPCTMGRWHGPLLQGRSPCGTREGSRGTPPDSGGKPLPVLSEARRARLPPAGGAPSRPVPPYPPPRLHPRPCAAGAGAAGQQLRGSTPRARTSASRRPPPPPSDNGPRAAAAVSSVGPCRGPGQLLPGALQVRLLDVNVSLLFLFTFSDFFGLFLLL